jgi:multimeric flavodoxin WrbA
MQVLGIVGSPRRGGNTETLVDAILDGAKTEGASIEKVVLDELDLRPCKGCFACSKTKKCIQDDDMNTLATKMQESNVWILGTPIYWWGPSGQFKIFLDRWVSIARTIFRGKKVILAIPMGGGSEGYARHTVAIFEDVFQYLHMDHLGTILAPGSDHRDAVRNEQRLMDKAHRMGIETAKKL